MIDDRILKVERKKESRGGQIYPYNILPLLPDRSCVFDSFHGTIGLDIYPFAVTTRINASNQIFVKVYEDMDDTDEGERP